MRAVALAVCLMLAVALATEVDVEVAKHKKPKARWGVPSFEDEACVICQYVVQRIENRIVQHLDRLDNNKQQTVGLVPSTQDPFAAPSAPQPAVPGTAQSPADLVGTSFALTTPTAPHMTDLSFEPSLEYKKSQIRSLRSRWGGTSILRKLFEEFITDFCAQDRLPELYVPACGMMYEHARKMMKLIYYGFPNDQVCLMSNLCGRTSYFTSPTAVHDPVMSLYWNNKRGLDGFEGGVSGTTAKRLQAAVAAPTPAPPPPAAPGAPPAPGAPAPPK